jgi:hypothetical protein
MVFNSFVWRLVKRQNVPEKERDKEEHFTHALSASFHPLTFSACVALLAFSSTPNLHQAYAREKGVLLLSLLTF